MKHHCLVKNLNDIKEMSLNIKWPVFIVKVHDRTLLFKDRTSCLNIFQKSIDFKDINNGDCLAILCDKTKGYVTDICVLYNISNKEWYI